MYGISKTFNGGTLTLYVDVRFICQDDLIQWILKKSHSNSNFEIVFVRPNVKLSFIDVNNVSYMIYINMYTLFFFIIACAWNVLSYHLVM